MIVKAVPHTAVVQQESYCLFQFWLPEEKKMIAEELNKFLCELHF